MHNSKPETPTLELATKIVYVEADFPRPDDDHVEAPAVHDVDEDEGHVDTDGDEHEDHEGHVDGDEHEDHEGHEDGDAHDDHEDGDAPEGDHE